MATKTAVKYDVKWDLPGWAQPVELLSFQKSPDLVTKVRIITVEGLQYIDVRDFIVSQNQFGRGYWLPADPHVLTSVASSLLDAAARVEGGNNDQD